MGVNANSAIELKFFYDRSDRVDFDSRRTLDPMPPNPRNTNGPRTRQVIKEVFSKLDYTVLGDVYCDEGGEAFWNVHRKKCQTIGIKIGEALKRRLKPKGKSLYVGAGVAELPMLVLETLEMNRTIQAHNLREREVDVLNRACHGLPFTIHATDAQTARGTVDHLWMASVLNDPECFPETSALAYGRADPVRFDPTAFQRERTQIQELLNACLPKLLRPGILSTTVEEVTWVTDWLTRHRIPFHVEEQLYPTAIVGDPLCFIRVEPGRKAGRKGRGG